MLDYLDSMCLRAKIRFLGFVNELRTGEAGVSAFVATVLLMVIVVSLATIFWESISKWFTDMLEKIFGNAGGIGGVVE
jgi:hypothetical protein